MVYTVAKAFHIFGLLLWSGGLIGLHRVLHLRGNGSPIPPPLLRRLVWGVLAPGLSIALVSGVLMIVLNPLYARIALWLHIKLGLVVLLLGYSVGVAGLGLVRAEEPEGAVPRRLLRWGEAIAFVFAGAAIWLALRKMPLLLGGA